MDNYYYYARIKIYICIRENNKLGWEQRYTLSQCEICKGCVAESVTD